jgi:hypothetical protein
MATMSKIYRKIDSVYDRMDMAKVVVDLPLLQRIRISLIQSNQTNQGRIECLGQDERVNTEATAISQMAEWGMHALTEKNSIRRKRRKKNNL